MWWSGLRGAIALALACEVPNAEGGPHDRIVAVTIVVCMVTIFGFGGSTSALLARMKVKVRTARASADALRARAPAVRPCGWCAWLEALRASPPLRFAAPLIGMPGSEPSLLAPCAAGATAPLARLPPRAPPFQRRSLLPPLPRPPCCVRARR